MTRKYIAMLCVLCGALVGCKEKPQEAPARAPMQITIVSALALEDVNLREGPSPDTPRVKTILKNTELKVLGDPKALWINVESEDKQGYINSKYLSIQEKQVEAPIENPSTPPERDAQITKEKGFSTKLMSDFMANIKNFFDFKHDFIDDILGIILVIGLIICLVKNANNFPFVLLATIAGTAIVFAIFHFTKYTEYIVSFDYNGYYHVNIIANSFIMGFAINFGAFAGGFVGFMGYFLTLLYSGNTYFVNTILSALFPSLFGIAFGLLFELFKSNEEFDIKSLIRDLIIIPIGAFISVLACNFFAYFWIANLIIDLKQILGLQHTYGSMHPLFVFFLDLITFGIAGIIVDVLDFVNLWLPNFGKGTLLGWAALLVFALLLRLVKEPMKHFLHDS